MIFLVAAGEKRISDWIDLMCGKDKVYRVREFGRSCKMRHGDRRRLSAGGRRDEGGTESVDDGDGKVFAMAADGLAEDQNDL